MRAPAPPSEVERVARDTGLPPMLAAMLWSRGLRDDVAAELNPPLRPVPIAALTEAAERLQDAINNGRRIVIYGDYDADGISGTAVLLLGLRALGGRVRAFIPDRLTDGYGLNMGRVAELAAAADLLVTVDCGITNLAEVAALREAGVEVIVTDHHTPGEARPDCLVVHPRDAADAAPGAPELTGAGVAWHLLWALRRREGLPAPLEYADLASIGTVADVAPLLGDNRALVQEGLRRLADSAWAGLRASVAHSRLRTPIDARSIAFVLAPRLNAAGRLGEADYGLELLTTASETRARELAIYLDARNQERRRIQDEMFERTLYQVNADAPALVVNDADGHPGVMGIVASKLLERFYKPVFIIAGDKGSVRSTPGISAVAALRHAGDHLLRYGGHAQAAGFALDPGNLSRFRDAICEFVARHPQPQPEIVLDHMIGNGEASTALLASLATLEPLGQGLDAPVFGLSDALASARAVGRDHGTLQLVLGGMRGVGWNMGERAASLVPGLRVDAAVSLDLNEYRGETKVEFRLKELRNAGPLPLAPESAAEADGTGVEIRRGPPAEKAKAATVDGPDFPRGADTYHLVRLPLGGTLEELAAPMTELLASGAALHFNLHAAALDELRAAVEALPSLADARRAFVNLQRGRSLPWDERRNSLMLTVLRELDLVDERGFALSGQKREPWTSPTLLKSETERYRLASFRSAWLHYDDDAFALAVHRLFGSERAILNP